MCCGQKRSTLRSASFPVTTPTARQSPPEIPRFRGNSSKHPAPSNHHAPSNHAPRHWVYLQYTETSPIRVFGPATGQRYEFSGSSPIQKVDQNDAARLLQLPYFRARMGMP